MNHETDDGATSQTNAEAPSDEPACTPDSEPTETELVVIGIRIREASRIYHFSAPRGRVLTGDYVVVNRAPRRPAREGRDRARRRCSGA